MHTCKTTWRTCRNCFSMYTNWSSNFSSILKPIEWSTFSNTSCNVHRESSFSTFHSKIVPSFVFLNVGIPTWTKVLLLLREHQHMQRLHFENEYISIDNYLSKLCLGSIWKKFWQSNVCNSLFNKNTLKSNYRSGKHSHCTVAVPLWKPKTKICRIYGTNLLLRGDKAVMKNDWTVIFGHLHRRVFSLNQY